MKPCTTALLLSAMMSPAFTQEPAAPQAQPEAPPARVQQRQVQVQRVVVDAPDGVDGQAVVIVRHIEVDADGNVLVMDENGDVIVDAENDPFGPNADGGSIFRGAQVGADPFNPAGNLPMIQATYLGVNCQPLDKEEAALMHVDPGTGLHLSFVAPDSPAAAAGLLPGDVLLRLDDQILVNAEQLAVLIRTFDAGERVDLTVLRDGEELLLSPELVTAEVPEIGPGGRNLNQTWRVAPGGGQPQRAQPGEIDMELQELNPDGFQEHMIEIERRIRDQQEILLRFIDEIEGGQDEDRLRKLQELQQHMQLRLQRGHGPANMNIAINDGRHAICVQGHPNGPRKLHIFDRRGNVLFDGDLPRTDEQWQDVPGEVRDKARQLLRMHRIRFEGNPMPMPMPAPAPEAEPEAAPEAEPAPEADGELPQA